MSAEVSVVVVNFNSGAFLPGCLESLAPERQGGLGVETVVVDNASPQDQTAALADAEARGARVLRLERNTGYAGGCNRGLAETRAPTVFLLNADVRAGPGALPTLARLLAERPEVALAEPRCYVDEGRAWQQPSFDLLTPREVVAGALGRVLPGLARRRGLARLRAELVAWRATEPLERRALSGAFLAARREVLQRLGGFDESFPLAFEDSDLFHRARAAGLSLVLDPAAEAVHYAHRSRITVIAESIAKDRIGRRRYLAKHHGPLAVWLDRAATRAESLAGRREAAPPPDRIDLGPLSSPPELTLTGPPGPAVLQLALDPSFALAAGRIQTEPALRFSSETWRSLLPVPLHVRAFGLEDLQPRGTWTLQPLA